jgi:ABC-2 type transport system ATP-binding protein
VKIIETHGLRKTFKTRKSEVVAVRGVNLSVAEGQIFGFLGPNGAGKSTTLRMLATLLPPTGGEAKVVGYDLLRKPVQVRERIGYVSQEGGASQEATGRENLYLQGRLYHVKKSQIKERIEHLLTAFNLTSFADRPVSTYSGGQRRRLDIAMSIIHEPKLLFLDEPTTGLDPQSRASLWDEVRRMKQNGTTVFVTTHYMDEADALCDQLAIIDHGEIVVEGTPDALKRQISGDIVKVGLPDTDGTLERAKIMLARHPFVRETEVVQDENGETLLKLFVERGEAVLPAVVRAFDEVGIGLREIAVAKPSLDDVFLKQTGRTLREDTPSDAPSKKEAVAV